MSTSTTSSRIAAVVVMLFAAWIVTFITLHEISHCGFFHGLWHGFTFLFRIITWPWLKLTLFVEVNPLYVTGYFSGLFAIALITLKQIKRI